MIVPGIVGLPFDTPWMVQAPRHDLEQLPFQDGLLYITIYIV